jgi:hypothetical protein
MGYDKEKQIEKTKDKMKDAAKDKARAKAVSDKALDLAIKEMMKEAEAQQQPKYNMPIDITQEQWGELLLNNDIFTQKNRELVATIYFMGGKMDADDFAEEEGYSSTYPYKQVAMTLGKRIQEYLNIDVPKDEEGKLLWWHILFLGYLEDNNNFTWYLRPELSEAIELLIAEGKLRR